ncbi:unnamed protein product [Auanema sp. JU1783]|nr:unnamed protein product [Auanema sp. JU1783]
MLVDMLMDIAIPDDFTKLLPIVIPIIVYGVYWIITIPVNRIRTTDNLGYNFKNAKTGAERAFYVKKIQRMRKAGDLPPVFPNGWYCISESSTLKPKQIKEVPVFGTIMSLVRSEKGKVHLMESYCPHLGANFNVGGRVVNDNCVQCPFHGWIFSAETGKCVKIPYDDGTIPPQAQVQTFPVVEKNKNIYCWYHSDGEEPEWQVPDIEEIGKSWTYGGRTEHEIQCHAQEIPENGADIAHLNYLHFSAPDQGSDITRISLDDMKPRISHAWNGSWTEGVGKEKHIGTMILEQYLVLFSRFKLPFTDSYLRAEQHGPGIVLMYFDFGIIGKGCVLQHVTPEEPLLQRVRFNMFSNCPRWYNKFFIISEAIQFERDIYIWNNKQYVKEPLVVRNDGPIKKHRRWYSQFYTDNSPRLVTHNRLDRPVFDNFDW